ncbi:MAG: UbiA family prenyltransferase, partial [Flavobacteriaceae bacterium]
LYEPGLRLICFFFALRWGLLSVAVLNLNNMRDYKSDRESHKQTLVVLIGLKAAKGYHQSLIVLAIALSILGGYQANFSSIQYLFGLSFLPLLWHLRIFYDIENERDY